MPDVGPDICAVNRYQEDWPVELKCRTSDNKETSGETNQAYSTDCDVTSIVLVNEPKIPRFANGNDGEQKETAVTKLNLATWQKSDKYDKLAGQVTLKAAKQQNISGSHQSKTVSFPTKKQLPRCLLND
jgi:hypothetical protein